MNEIKKIAMQQLGTIGRRIVKELFHSNGHKEENKEIVMPVIKEVIEPTFGGIKESLLNELAQSISRGEGVKILSERALIFYYKSKRGREKQSTKFVLDEAGNLIRYEGMGPYALAHTPKFFQEKLLKALDKN